MYTKLKACPNCGGTELQNERIVTDHAVSGEGFALVSCTHCGLWMTNPFPSDQQLAAYRSEQYHSLLNHSLLSTNFFSRRRYAKAEKLLLQLVEGLTEKKRILSVGSKPELFLEKLSQPWTKAAIDIKQPRSEEHVGDIQWYPSISALDKRKFDIVLLWFSLNRLPQLGESLALLRRRLHKSGTMLLAMHNRTSPDAHHYGDHWAGYDVPRAAYHFHHASLKDVLKRAKLKIQRIIPLPTEVEHLCTVSELWKGSNKPKAMAKRIAKSSLAEGGNKNNSCQLYLVRK